MKKFLLIILLLTVSLISAISQEHGWDFKNNSDPFEKRYLLYSFSYGDSIYYSLEYIRGAWNFIIKNPKVFHNTKINKLEFSYEKVLILESGDTIKTHKVLEHVGFKQSGGFLIVESLFGDQLLNFKNSDNIYIRLNNNKKLTYKLPNKRRLALFSMFF